MTRAGTIAKRDARLLRAALICLAVLAQLMLPAAALRAQALAGELCVASTGTGGSSPSKSHAHDQQCAHCRLHDCSAPAPPPVRAVFVEPPAFKPAAVRQAVAVRLPLLRVQPPPTGPPAG